VTRDSLTWPSLSPESDDPTATIRSSDVRSRRLCAGRRSGRHARVLAVLLLSASVVCACTEHATLPFSAGIGPHPTLPPPHRTLFPTVNIASAKGWPAGLTPTAAPGLRVTAFAENLDHPRWLYVLPNGDVLVAETNAPPRPEDSKGNSRLDQEDGDEAGRSRRAERKQDHIASRHQGRWGG
jgi:glucose/arabinose dehydrogenase